MTYPNNIPGTYITSTTTTSNSITLGSNWALPGNPGTITIQGQSVGPNQEELDKSKQASQLMNTLELPIVQSWGSHQTHINSDDLYDLIMDPTRRKKLIVMLQNPALW